LPGETGKRDSGNRCRKTPAEIFRIVAQKKRENREGKREEIGDLKKQSGRRFFGADEENVREREEKKIGKDGVKRSQRVMWGDEEILGASVGKVNKRNGEGEPQERGGGSLLM